MAKQNQTAAAPTPTTGEAPTPVVPVPGMNELWVSDDVLHALVARSRPLVDTGDDVLRRLLDLPARVTAVVSTAPPAPADTPTSTHKPQHREARWDVHNAALRAGLIRHLQQCPDGSDHRRNAIVALESQLQHLFSKADRIESKPNRPRWVRRLDTVCQNLKKEGILKHENRPGVLTLTKQGLQCDPDETVSAPPPQAKQRRKTTTKQRRKTTTKHDEGAALPGWRYQEPLIFCLQQLGGAARGAEIRSAVYELMKDEFLAGDLERIPKGDVRWQNKLDNARQALSKRGLIARGVPHGPAPAGMWMLTEEGKRYQPKVNAQPVEQKPAEDQQVGQPAFQPDTPSAAAPPALDVSTGAATAEAAVTTPETPTGQSHDAVQIAGLGALI